MRSSRMAKQYVYFFGNGKAEGKAELLIKQLTKRFNKVSEEYRKEIRKIPEDTIDIIATEIFDLQSIEDIKKYF